MNLAKRGTDPPHSPEPCALRPVQICKSGKGNAGISEAKFNYVLRYTTMAKTLGWGNSSVEERAVCQFLGVGGWAVPAPRGRGMFVHHYTIYFILWHDFSYRTRRQLMSTSKGTRERVVEGWRGGIRTGQRAQ